MKPIIDISQVANNPAFIELDRRFGLAGRLDLYNKAGTDEEALKYIDAMVNVLDRDDFARQTIIRLKLDHAAGSSLAALSYARSTIQGTPPKTPFNDKSTAERLVLTPAG
jgi:hypothetical protein